MLITEINKYTNNIKIILSPKRPDLRRRHWRDSQTDESTSTSPQWVPYYQSGL